MSKPLIPNTLKRLAKRLFPESVDQDAFISSIVTPVTYPVAVAWLHQPALSTFRQLPQPQWMPSWVQLVPFDERPGRHELHQQGDYYCLDPSSVFMAHGMTIADREGVVLDVCASPGGKSVLAWKHLRPDHLWSNEVTGKRIPALISNLKRCRIRPVSVTSSDPAMLADSAAGGADVVLVDAPCSGQSLVARGKTSPGCFHPATINMNANRQRRILANSAVAVKSGGWLIYMTCTYSFKENERNVDWFLKKHPAFRACSVPSLKDYQSSLTEVSSYRMWPGDGEGAGGFVAVFQNCGAGTARRGSLAKTPVRWQQD